MHGDMRANNAELPEKAEAESAGVGTQEQQARAAAPERGGSGGGGGRMLMIYWGPLTRRPCAHTLDGVSPDFGQWAVIKTRHDRPRLNVLARDCRGMGVEAIVALAMTQVPAGRASRHTGHARAR